MNEWGSSKCPTQLPHLLPPKYPTPQLTIITVIFKIPTSKLTHPINFLSIYIYIKNSQITNALNRYYKISNHCIANHTIPTPYTTPQITRQTENPAFSNWNFISLNLEAVAVATVLIFFVSGYLILCFSGFWFSFQEKIFLGFDFDFRRRRFLWVLILISGEEKEEAGRSGEENRGTKNPGAKIKPIF